jgi:membrane protein YdbS with pleckstrin-like domain
MKQRPYLYTMRGQRRSTFSSIVLKIPSQYCHVISHSSPFVCIVCFSKLIHLFFLALFAYSWLLSSANVKDSSVCLCLFFVFMFMKYKCIRYETHKNNHNFISDYCILFKFYLMILQSLVIRHANLLKLDKKKFYFSYFN